MHEYVDKWIYWCIGVCMAITSHETVFTVITSNKKPVMKSSWDKIS